MLKAIALSLAIGVIGGGVALAQPVHRPLPAGPGGVILVKHDKEDKGEEHGKKLGHHKHETDQNLGDNGTTTTTTRRSNRFGTTTTTTTTRRSWTSPYYSGAPPYYGDSYATPYYYPPPYYRGY
jgi:hypothetical protein